MAYGDGRPLGPVQFHCLLVLSVRGQATVTDWGAWWPYDGKQASQALWGLARRGLVDTVRVEGRGTRVWAITSDGEDHLTAHGIDPLDALEDE